MYLKIKKPIKKLIENKTFIKYNYKYNNLLKK